MGRHVSLHKNVSFPNCFCLGFILLEIVSSLRWCLIFSSMSKGKKLEHLKPQKIMRRLISAFKFCEILVTKWSIFMSILIILLKLSICYFFYYQYTNYLEWFDPRKNAIKKSKFLQFTMLWLLLGLKLPILTF